MDAGSSDSIVFGLSILFVIIIITLSILAGIGVLRPDYSVPISPAPPYVPPIPVPSTPSPAPVPDTPAPIPDTPSTPSPIPDTPSTPAPSPIPDTPSTPAPPPVVIPVTPPTPPSPPIPDAPNRLDITIPQIVYIAIQTTAFASTRAITSRLINNLLADDVNVIAAKQAIKEIVDTGAKGITKNEATALADDETLKRINMVSKAAKGASILELALFIFDTITIGIDLADVDGYSKVHFKQGYYALQQELNKRFKEMLMLKGLQDTIVIGPLDDLPLLVLNNKIYDKVMASNAAAIQQLVNKYSDYLIANNITDPDKIADYVQKNLETDLGLTNLLEKSKQSLCIDLGGVNTSVTINSTTGEQQIFCSYSQDFCKANKAYSWPLLINSTSPTLTTTTDEINAGLYVGASVQIDNYFEPGTQTPVVGVVTSLDGLGKVDSDLGPDIINVQGSNGGIYRVNKNHLQRVYSDMYVEWNSQNVNGTSIGYCSMAMPAMRALCYDNGLQYDEDKKICIVDETYCKSKALDWKYNEVIKDYDCYIGSGQEVVQALFGITLTSKIRQTFDLSQYEKCGPSEVDGGYVCAGCPSGYSQDNILNSILAKASEVTGTAFATGTPALIAGSIASPFFFGLGIVAALTSGVNAFLNSVCYEECPVGSSSVGPICWSQCPPGFTDFGVGCAPPSCGIGAGTDVGDGTIPPVLPCPPSTPGTTDITDTAGSCWKGGLIIPGYDPAGRSINSVCPEGKEKLGALCYTKCKDDEERNGLLCYPKCKPGMKKVGCCICAAVCPPGTTDDGVSCTKNSSVRKSVFQLPRTKKRIVPYSTKNDTPIKAVVEPSPPPPQPQPIICPEGKTLNVWTQTCANTCPDGYERFKGLCWPTCQSEAIKKGLTGTFVPSIDFPQLCFSTVLKNADGTVSKNVVVDDGFASYRACPDDTEYLMSACYPKCPTGYSKNEGSPGICWKDTCS